MTKAMNQGTPSRKHPKITVEAQDTEGRLAGAGSFMAEPSLAESLYYVIKPEWVPEEQEEVAGRVPEEADAVDDEFLREAMDAEIEEATQAYYADSPPPEREQSAVAIVASDAGFQYYRMWQQGLVEDGHVAWRWGAEVLRLFHQMGKTDDLHLEDVESQELSLQAALKEEAVSNLCQTEGGRCQQDRRGEEPHSGCRRACTCYGHCW